MTSLLFVFVFVAVMIGLGRPVVLWLDGGKRLNEGERLAFSYALGCLAVFYGVFIIVPYRFDGVTMWGLALVLSALAIPGLMRMPWSLYVRAAKSETAASLGDRWTGALWLTAGLITASVIIQGMAPPNDYDSLMYHLTLPLYDLKSGHSAIPWDRAIPQILLPSLGGNLSRFALATMNAGVAQMLHGMLGALAALAAALITNRLGFNKRTAITAAIFFLVFRAVVWEMATVEVEPLLAAFSGLALLAYLIWRENDAGPGLMALFGLMIGGATLTKMLGFPIALSFSGLFIYDLAVKRRSFLALSTGPLVALGVYAPQAVKSMLAYGNPLMPLFNNIFNPGAPVFFKGTELTYGTGRGLLDLLSAPWNMFVLPMYYFDGMVAGAPYLLAFAPLVLIDRDKARRWLPALSFVAIFMLFWFWMLSQQVRFIIPIVPVLAGVAAAGCAVMWRAVKDMPVLKVIFVAVLLVLGLNQALFVGIYGMIRLPVALGLVDNAAYLGKTPTMNGSFYKVCSYIKERLKPGEKYFSMIQPHSYYCPQTSAVRIYFPDEAKWWMKSKTPPAMSLDEFRARAKKADFKFFLVPRMYENKRNRTAHPVMEKIDLAAIRSGAYVGRAIKNLKPLIESRFAAVYDGEAVIEALRRMR
mgnify:CR=1 FL=1